MRTRVWMAGLLFMLAGGMFMWQRGSSAEPKGGGESPKGAGKKSEGAKGEGKGGGRRGGGGPTPVVAVTAHTGDIGVYFVGLGTVTPIYTVNVRARVDGELMKVYYREGDIVRAGAPLVEIDP